MELVVGATGLLGSEICRLLCKEGREVYGLIRNSSDPNKLDLLRSYGVSFIHGDLKDFSSIQLACKGVTNIISTASSTLSRQEGDSIHSVDLEGQLNLVNAAKNNGVGNFVFISFRNNPNIQFPLTEVKRKVEEKIIASGMNYTIIQAGYFMEIWLSEALGFDVFNHRANIFGDGHHKLSWISYKDVAKFVNLSLNHPEAKNKIIELGGPEAKCPSEVVAIFEKTTGSHFDVHFIPESEILEEKAKATNDLEKSFAGLKLQYAAGDHINMKNTLRTFPMEMTTVENYAEQIIKYLKKHKY